VRVVGLAAVGDVEAPDAYAATGRPEGACLRSDRVAEAGHVREADGDVLEADAADQRDAVPLVVADGGDVVPP
jgi:hypothetical protein